MFSLFEKSLTVSIARGAEAPSVYAVLGAEGTEDSPALYELSLPTVFV